MDKIICVCNKAKSKCELICERWKNKNTKPDEIFYSDKWPKEKLFSQEEIK